MFVNLANHHTCKKNLAHPQTTNEEELEVSSVTGTDSGGSKCQSGPSTSSPSHQLGSHLEKQIKHLDHTGQTRNWRLQTELLQELKTLRNACHTRSSADTEDPLLTKLTQYHSRLYLQADNILTEKLSAEVLDVIYDQSKVDNLNRTFSWSKEEELHLNKLNAQAHQLWTPNTWHWAAEPNSARSILNHKRLQFLVQHELGTAIIQCSRCKSTGIQVGLDQLGCSLCYDCMKVHSENTKSVFQESDAWYKV